MSEERLLALLSHLLAIVPGVGILGPLVIYLIKRDDPFVRDNARESLNFQLTIIILYIIAGVLVLVLIGLFLFWVIWIINAVLVIVATVRASEGQVYQYPVNLRLIK
jgi:uncharacterized Tic20 family protein